MRRALRHPRSAERATGTRAARLSAALVVGLLLTGGSSGAQSEHRSEPKGSLVGHDAPERIDGSGRVYRLKDPPHRRWSISLHAGLGEPLSQASTFLDHGSSYGLDLEYAFNDTWAVELFYGRDEFDGTGGALDLGVDHLALNGKAYLGSGLWRPFVVSGIGLYDLAPGPSEAGFGSGFGVQFDFRPRLAFELTAKVHWVDTGGADLDFVPPNVFPRRFDLEFVTVNIGLRIR